MTDKQEFNNLLEEYIFSVADKFIELATEIDQSKLIDLINTLNKSSLVNKEVDSTLFKAAFKQNHQCIIGMKKEELYK